jgi:hypothetical protein
MVRIGKSNGTEASPGSGLLETLKSLLQIAIYKNHSL